MILWVANNGDANAKSRGDRAFRNAICRVIRAFGVDVGPQLFQKRLDVGFSEEHDVVHTAEGRHDLRARAFIENRPTGSLQVAHAGIGVHTNNQNIAFAARAFKIADVADVQHIEAAARMTQRAAPEASPRMASRSSSRETVAVPRFITTRPPAMLAMCAASRGEAPQASARV